MNVKSKIDDLFNNCDFKFIHKIGHSKNPFPPSLNDKSFPEEGTWTELELKLKEHFASIVGSIIYLSITCRPDIACATSKLARGMHGASRFQVNLLKTTLQYLNDHRDTPLVFKANDSLAKQHFRDMTADDPTVFSVSASDGHTDKDGTDICVGFSDANYAYLCSEKKRSTSGYAFFVLGNTVSWKSKLQPLTAGSTHEAELIALSYASDEGVWLRKLLNEIGFAVLGHERPGTKSNVDIVHTQVPTGGAQGRDAELYLSKMGPTPCYTEPTMDDPVGAIPSDKLQMAPTPIMVDNFGTTKTANNPVSSTQGSKHIDVRYFRVRDFIKNKLLRVISCRTHVNIADFFTKGLPTTTFQSFKSKLMGCVETF